MNTADHFDLDLAAWLEEDARGRVPAHLADVLAQTAQTRQRPSWASLGRWLPAQAVAAWRTMPATRTLAIAAALLLLLVAALAVASLAGSRNHVPAPLRPGGNGLIIRSANSDIVALDPVTGRETVIIGGIDLDRIPRVSPDGTLVAFDRAAGGGQHQVMVAGVDGTGLRPLGQPVTAIDGLVWSPDGTRLAFDAEVDGVLGMRVVGLDGTDALVAEHGPGSPIEAVGDIQWSADGSGLVFRGWQPGGRSFGLWLVCADGTGLRSILPAAADGREPLYPALSPDGRTVAYSFADEGVIRFADVTTGTAIPVLFPGGSGEDRAPAWSPDGSRLAFQRGGSIVIGPATGGAVVPVGPSFTDELAPAFTFSPDGTTVLAYYPADQSTWLLDAAGGPGRQLSIRSASLPSWQRTAP